MFVKLIYWDIERDDYGNIITQKQNSQVLYECESIQMVESIRTNNLDCEHLESFTESIMNIYMNDRIDDSFHIELPLKSKKQLFELFVMNDEGKTIDHYCY